MATAKTSLSADGPKPRSMPPRAGPDGFVAGFLHMPPDFTSPAPETHHHTAAILLSGAGGGVVGPSSIYLSLGARLAALGLESRRYAWIIDIQQETGISYQTGSARTAEAMLLGFIVKCTGLGVDESEKKTIIDRELVEDGERTELMKKGGDLKPPESLE
ncbi:hypothetical protein F4811DRAFT_555504 [Daldinia bambusicola]|nr:hypothetical protein F4811DRAFT_555504 [Daldinia bambusicola]